MTATDWSSGRKLPSGVVLGRVSQGTGPVEQITLDNLSGMILGRKGRLYQFGFSWPGGVPGNSQLMGHHSVSIGVTFPPNFTAYSDHASQAGGTANATGSTVFNVDQ